MGYNESRWSSARSLLFFVCFVDFVVPWKTKRSNHEIDETYYPGSKEGHIPTRSASEGSGAFPSLARRVNMQQHAELPCRGNTKKNNDLTPARNRRRVERKYTTNTDNIITHHCTYEDPLPNPSYIYLLFLPLIVRPPGAFVFPGDVDQVPRIQGMKGKSGRARDEARFSVSSGSSLRERRLEVAQVLAWGPPGAGIRCQVSASRFRMR